MPFIVPSAFSCKPEPRHRLPIIWWWTGMLRMGSLRERGAFGYEIMSASRLFLNPNLLITWLAVDHKPASLHRHSKCSTVCLWPRERLPSFDGVSPISLDRRLIAYRGFKLINIPVIFERYSIIRAQTLLGISYCKSLE